MIKMKYLHYYIHKIKMKIKLIINGDVFNC